MKLLFDRKAKKKKFLPGDLVLRWNARKKDSGKNGKFDHISYGPFKISSFEGKNSFLLENLDGKILNAPVNARFLKHYME
jgi:hypothetical protein